MKTTENNFQSSCSLSNRNLDYENGDVVEKSEDYEDEDTCSPQELEKLFKHKYQIHDEQGVCSDENYILSIAKDNFFTCIAAGLSDGSVRVFEVNSEKGLYIKPPISNRTKDDLAICGVCFMDETPNLLLVGTCHGFVRLLDLRTRQEVARYENNPSHNADPKDILCFDRNSNSRLLCMGTVQRNSNVNLLFYDTRSANQIFRFWESHEDDVTSLRFHTQNPDLLCTGSTDCLINVFDVKETNEDDALLTTINTEDTVYKVNWHVNSKGKDLISCISNTNCFKSYDIEGNIVAEFDRLKITETIKRKNELNCNLINCYSTINNDMMLITGSNLNNGSTLRSCLVQNDQLTPFANFEGNKQIVRDSIFDARTNILITGGESGVVTLWTPQSWNTPTANNSSSSSQSLKMKTNKSNKFAPY